MKNGLFEQQRSNYEINGILWEKKNYAAGLKNAINFLVA
jgi:hypothetical protein